MINQYYQYPGSPDKFKLIKIDAWIYRFEGGHWCTDLIFMDMIPCEKQLKLL